MQNTKVIVSNRTALKKKYGATNLKAIDEAIQKLVEADKQRGIETSIVNLDDAEQMGKLNAPVVSAAKNEQQNKDAIDKVWAALQPDFLGLLDATDIIPHQGLQNPIQDPANDPDRKVPSDLPYACEHAYSNRVQDFLSPSRVVSRIPGVVGAKDPKALLAALEQAVAVAPQSRDKFDRYFALTAAVWKSSTATSVRNIFGSARSVHKSPPEGPEWTVKQLQPLTHFVNCHGSDSDPFWYGQLDDNYPQSVSAAQITGKIKAGTIAAAECCYGAELYAPGTGQMGISNVYMASKATAFCGSTTIAYGPAEGQGEADLITQYFIINLRKGASVAQAMLEARQQFVQSQSPLSPTSLKTIAQFVCFGDPSAQPVQTVADAHLASAKGVDDKQMAERQLVHTRGIQSKRLMAAADGLSVTAGWAEHDPSLKASAETEKAFESMRQALGASAGKRVSYRVQGGAASTRTRSLLLSEPETVYHIHLVALPVPTTRGLGQPPFKPMALLEVLERGGQVISRRVLHRK